MGPEGVGFGIIAGAALAYYIAHRRSRGGGINPRDLTDEQRKELNAFNDTKRQEYRTGVHPLPDGYTQSDVDRRYPHYPEPRRGIRRLFHPFMRRGNS